MSEQNVQTPVVEQDINEILQIRRDKLAKLQAEGNNPFEITKFDKTHSSKQIIDNFVDPVEGEEGEPQIVAIAGRMISRRIMGKASFCHILDGEGTIQLYVKRDEIGVDEYQAF